MRNLSTVGHGVLLNPYTIVGHRDKAIEKYAKFEGTAKDILKT